MVLLYTDHPVEMEGEILNPHFFKANEALEGDEVHIFGSYPEIESHYPDAVVHGGDKPDSSNTKAEIKDWLDSNNIEYKASDKKAELLDLIQ